jgi:hypothetical protein
VIKAQAHSDSKSKTLEANKRFDLSTFYDEGGYLHRYKVKEALDELLQKLCNSPR